MVKHKKDEERESERDRKLRKTEKELLERDKEKPGTALLVQPTEEYEIGH